MLPLVYGGIFAFPLTLEEIRSFTGRPVDAGRISELLDGELADQVFRSDGYVGLKGAEAGVEARRSRLQAVAGAWQVARRRARLIACTPFVRGLMVTGSLAHESYAPDADIDYLVLVAPRRIFTVFAVLGTVQRLTSVHTLCPNYYLAVDRMELPERDYFIAREVLAAAPVVGSEACTAFQEANAWVYDLFPNARRRSDGCEDPPRPLATRALEWLLSGRLGDALEALMARLLVTRIHAHYASCAVPIDPGVVQDARSNFRLRFHARLHRERVRARLVQALESAGVSGAADVVDVKAPGHGASGRLS